MTLLDRRHFLGATLLGGAATALPWSARAATVSFEEALAKARGKTIYWHAWGGDEHTNAFIAEVGALAQSRYGISITHVKLKDTAEAVARVVAEKTAGRDTGGSVDLIWINGPNFNAMKAQHLLFGPFAEQLPNWPLVDVVNKRSNIVDFTLPVEGYASPWRLAQIVYVSTEKRQTRDKLPRSIPAFVDWATANPGRLTHPNVRNFLGVTFFKQALYELSPDRDALAKDVTDDAFAKATAPLWAWYEKLRPQLWRAGRQFPESGPAQRQLLSDGEIDLYIAFNPAEAALGMASRQLPEGSFVYTLDGGTIGNTSFVAIPYNAANPEAAMVVANLLLDPPVQARMQDPRVLGNASVLDLSRLAPAARAEFEALNLVPGMPAAGSLGPVLPEPNSSWMTKLTQVFEQRYNG